MDSIKDTVEPERFDLGPGSEETLRRRQLALIGKVMAVFSDKIQNHLATIYESNGQLGNLVGQESECTEEERDRFAGIVSTIEKHVQILVQKSQHLSRFAQRTGAASCTFDAGELVEEAVFFSTRLARVRQVSLAQDAAGALPSLCSDPVQIHFIVSILINSMLERVSRGGKVILRAEPVEKGVLIAVEGQGSLDAAAQSPPGEGNPYWPALEQVVGDLGGRLQIDSIAHDINRTALFLPTEKVADTSQM